MEKAEFGLYELLLDRVTDDPGLGERVTSLLLAAWAGDDALRAVIAGEQVDFPTEAAPSGPANPQVFLSAVHVEGFRGIGPRATLRLPPGPGLTLVTGRNGSGKSSFAEGAELALTGECGRWTGRTAVWRDGWRNLHDGASSSITVDLVSAGTVGTTSIVRSWKPGEGLDGGDWTRQLHGAKRTPFDVTEWQDDLLAYRPFLSYRELGNLISGKPSELHDALKSVLGLGPLATAQTRLTQAKKQLSEPARTAADTRKVLRARLADIDDDRAARAAALLKPTSPDLAAVAALIEGTGDAEGLTALRALQALAPPESVTVADATARIRHAVDQVAAAATADVRTADTTSALLRAALRHHDGAGDGPCPVCETGRLDSDWRVRAQAQAAELDTAVAQLRSASTELQQAERAARQLIQPLPALLQNAPIDITAAIAAWRTWAEAAGEPTPAALAHALEEAIGPLVGAVRDLQARTEAELARRDEAWTPVSRALAAYVHQAEQAAGTADVLEDLVAAEKWLAATANELRDRRLAPFAAASQAVWGKLRQQSNVELGPIQLTGSSTQRKAKLDVRVDGAEGNTALSVMSQGELHSLALSLFLPRATVDESPFRFVLIDDPVQAMDPAKVDGLARALADVAHDRQVVVFTHDDRLAEAVRRLELDATVYEVQRAERSVVTVRPSEHPVRRYLDDARAVAKTPEVPAQLKGELVASYCRSAIEAACHRRIRAKRLGAGVSHADVERVLSDSHNTSKIITLALFDDPGRTHEVVPSLRKAGPWAANAYLSSKSGAHQGVADPEGLIKDTGRLTDWISR